MLIQYATCLFFHCKDYVSDICVIKLATTLEEKLVNREGDLQVQNGSVESWQSSLLTERIVRESETRNPRNEQQSQEFDIIFPVDGGHVGQRAFDFVIQMARKFSANLILIYIIER
jgi:hypothetical protein